MGREEAAALTKGQGRRVTTRMLVRAAPTRVGWLIDARIAPQDCKGLVMVDVTDPQIDPAVVRAHVPCALVPRADLRTLSRRLSMHSCVTCSNQGAPAAAISFD